MGGFEIEWLGTVRYADALALQHEALEARLRGERQDGLLLLEHLPVVTLGSSSKPENLLLPEMELEARGIEVHRVRRGGDVTFHAPGQLVGYLVVDLAARGVQDVHAFLRDIEASLIDALGSLGISGRRIAGMTGVFVDDGPVGGPDRKIASIGVGVRRWVTYHGFALNVSLDLRGFDVIVPCGLEAVEMTSVACELAADPARLSVLDSKVRACVAESFRRSFGEGPVVSASREGAPTSR